LAKKKKEQTQQAQKK
jgi:hypothetical protein